MSSERQQTGMNSPAATLIAPSPDRTPRREISIATWLQGALVAFAFMSTGCSSGDRPVIATVQGVVTYRGEPVSYAKLVFLPQQVTGGEPCVGQTDEDGNFSKIVMAKSGTEGAVTGKYTVTVTEGWPPDDPIPTDDMGQEKSPPRGKWPQKYRDSASTALQVEVVADEDNYFAFDLSK
ncbi:hypothetical protein [Schlesneria sp. T3-172]|uniref:hypothetical protein n=1 Tax=Schlesneria sphaerica TaxID=3373610 RepID=UPI0037CA5DBC